MKCSVLGEEDAAYIESYGSSLNSYRSSTDTNSSTDSSFGQMITYVLFMFNNNNNNNLDLEPPSSGINAGAGKTNDSRHWRHQGGDLPVPADVSGSSTG